VLLRSLRGGNHGDVTSPWSGPQQSHIAVVGGGAHGSRGTIDSDSCSGIKQPAWAFSHLLERFTR